VVVDPDPRELLEMYEVREVIDGLAASLCASKPLGKAQLRNLSEPMREMERWRPKRAGVPEVVRYITSHARFHVNMIECSGNRRLQDMIPLVQMSSQMGIARHIHLHRPELEEALAAAIPEIIEAERADHRATYDAIVAGDARKAETTARRHMQNMTQRIRRFAES
jgi:DNA-binding GntR family transcriptional regulator